MERSQHVCGQYSSTQTGPVGGVWAALKDCLAFAKYIPARVALTEPPRSRKPTGRAACCPLRVCQPTAPYGVRPAKTGTPDCHAGMRSLRSDEPRSVSCLPRDRSLPDRAHPYDRTTRPALTEPDPRGQRPRPRIFAVPTGSYGFAVVTAAYPSLLSTTRTPMSMSTRADS